MSHRVLAATYVVFALVALALTWSQNLAYFGHAGAVGFPSFLIDAAVNPAARSISFDILLICLAASFWMLFEGRRLRMRLVWLYVIFGFTVAISVTFPLFLAAREMRRAVKPEIEGRVGVADGVGLGLVTALVAYVCYYVWAHAG